MNLNNIQLDKQKKILIIIFCVFIIYVDLNYILKAQKSGLTALDAKIARLDKDVAALNRGLENMRVAKSKQSLTVGSKAAKSTKILPEGQISGLLQDISKEANQFNIKIIQMRPARQQIQAGKPATAGDNLIPYLITLDLISDYHSLGKFINSLENSLVFMRVQELKILTQVSDYLKQKVSLVIKTYVTK